MSNQIVFKTVSDVQRANLELGLADCESHPRLLLIRDQICHLQMLAFTVLFC